MADNDRHVLTLQEAAYMLRMSYRTAQRRIRDRKPPFDRAFREGGRWLIPRFDVECVLKGKWLRR